MNGKFKGQYIVVQYMFNDDDTKIDYDFIDETEFKYNRGPHIIKAGLNKLGVEVIIKDISQVTDSKNHVDKVKLATVARKLAYDYIFFLESKEMFC